MTSPNPSGVTVNPPGWVDPHGWAPAAQLQLVAETPLAGVALVNGTPNLLSWTAPNDGQLHSILVVTSLVIATTEVGGAVQVIFNDPGGTNRSRSLYTAGLAAGFGTPNVGGNLFVVQAGSLCTLTQTTALTGGAATIWAQIWAA